MRSAAATDCGKTLPASERHRSRRPADHDRPVVGAREGPCDLGSQRSPVGTIAPPETGYDGLDDGERQRLR